MAYPDTLDTLTDDSLGRVKINQPGKAVRSLDWDTPAKEINAWKSAIVELETAVGLPDGNGDAFTRIATLESGTFAPNSIQTFSSSPGNVASTTALVRVTYAAGTATLDFSALAIGQLTRIVKANASAYGIAVKGGASDQVNGGTAAASMTLPGSTALLSSTTSDPEWLVYRESATSLRVYQGGGNAVLLQGRSVSASAPTDGQPLVWDAASSTWKPTTMSPGRLTALASTLGLWLFDGNLNDSSVNARDLTVASGSAPTYVMRPGVGLFGQIVAASRYKETATDWSLVKDNVTVEVVLRGSQQAAFTHVLLGKTGTVDQNWWFRSSTNGVLEFNFYDSGGFVRISTAGQRVPPWKLTHIAATQEVSGGNTTVSLYLNGANVLTNVFTGNVPRTVASQQLVIGGQFGGNDYWSVTGAAEYHGIAIHSTVLDASTIAARSLAVLGAG